MLILGFGFCLSLMKYIIGRKIEMQQQYADNGIVVPFTLVKAGPCIVTQVKTAEKDGYNAIQFGFGTKKKIVKPQQGHLAGLIEKEGRGFACMKELRLQKSAIGVMRGDSVGVNSFAVGDVVDVTGTSKGKGFAGVVKRHHFHGQKASHGHKDQERMPGSIGSGGVQHVFKGKRMAGRMGGEQVTVKKLTIVSVDQENGILAVQGAIPGSRNGLIVIVAPEGEMVFEKNNSDEAGSDSAGQESSVVSEIPARQEEKLEEAPQTHIEQATVSEVPEDTGTPESIEQPAVSPSEEPLSEEKPTEEVSEGQELTPRP